MASKDTAQREIRKIAYALWMEEGQPEGRDKAHWEAAKAIWAFRHSEASEDEAAASGEAPASGKTSASSAKSGKRAH